MTCTEFPHCLDGGPCCIREKLAQEAMEQARQLASYFESEADQ